MTMTTMMVRCGSDQGAATNLQSPSAFPGNVARDFASAVTHVRCMLVGVHDVGVMAVQ